MKLYASDIIAIRVAHRRGLSVALLAKAYKVTENEILRAINYKSPLERAASAIREERLKKKERV